MADLVLFGIVYPNLQSASCIYKLQTAYKVMRGIQSLDSVYVPIFLNFKQSAVLVPPLVKLFLGTINSTDDRRVLRLSLTRFVPYKSRASALPGLWTPYSWAHPHRRPAHIRL